MSVVKRLFVTTAFFVVLSVGISKVEAAMPANVSNSTMDDENQQQMDSNTQPYNGQMDTQDQSQMPPEQEQMNTNEEQMPSSDSNKQPMN